MNELTFAAAILGRKGGCVKSDRKTAAVRENAKRPRYSARKASIAAVKRLTHNGRVGSWGTFKHRLMEHLGIPRERFHSWDAPQDWQDAYKRSFGR